MNIQLRFLSAACVALVLQGCAATRFEPIQDASADQNAKGLRYFDSSPYLLVTKTSDTTFNAQLLYLRDRTKEFQARSVCFLSVNSSNLTFGTATATGVLTNSVTGVDSTAVPAAIVQALGEVVSAAVKPPGATRKTEAETSNGIVLYLCKIVKRNNEWGVLMDEEDIHQ